MEALAIESAPRELIPYPLEAPDIVAERLGKLSNHTEQQVDMIRHDDILLQIDIVAKDGDAAQGSGYRYAAIGVSERDISVGIFAEISMDRGEEGTCFILEEGNMIRGGSLIIMRAGAVVSAHFCLF